MECVCRGGFGVNNYGVPFVSKFSDKKFTYLLLKISKNQAICKSRTAIY